MEKEIGLIYCKIAGEILRKESLNFRFSFHL